ncbi:MAG: S8 family serine peptidase [Phycisphaerales bacterium]
MFVLSLAPAAIAVAQVAPSPAQKPGDALVAQPELRHDPAFIAAIDPGVEYVPDALVIEVRQAAARVLAASPVLDAGLSGIGSLDELVDELGVFALEPLFPEAHRISQRNGLADLSGWYRVRIDPTKATLEHALALYAADPMVIQAQPIGVHFVYATPNDGNYASQWHLNQASDKDIDAPETWNTWTGTTNTIVAMMDSGVRYYHKDLGGSNASSANPGGTDGNIWINTAEKNGVAGVDDDGNGYVDDWVGWDFVTGITSGCWSGEDCLTADNDPRDFNGHGTHCAGNIAAINNNGYATCSSSGGWGNGTLQPTGNGVKVMALRIGYSGSYLGQEVGYIRMDFAASAFYYAANKGARIASCSWGSSNSGGIDAGITYFINAGGLVFVAAGNSNNQTAGYVNSRSDCYSVAATDQADKKASFSSYGTWVDISAPGVGIYSLYHVHSDPANDYIAALDGTSMATPITASVAASVWSRNPTWTAAQVWNQLKTTVDDISALNPSYSGLLGAGRVNLYNAINGAPPPPPPPTWGPGTMLMVFTGNPTIPGVGAVGGNQIVAYNPSTAAWSLYFDGNDVGLAGFTIDGLHRLANGDLLISVDLDGTLAGLVGGPSGTSIDDSDIVRFTPTSLGANTAGTWNFYFDGSDVGLTTSNEDIDAIAVATDGNLVISTTGSATVTGLSGLDDKDLIKFTATSLGANTAGTWSYFFDASDVGLTTTNEDVDAVNILSTGLITFSTLGAFSVTGASGDGLDLVDFSPTSLGATTAGTFALFFDGSGAGLAASANITAYAEIE